MSPRPPKRAASLRIDHLLPRASEFKAQLAQTKLALEPSEFWYPYDTYGNLWHLDAFLEGEHRDLATLAGDLPMLDVGCADGDLAFFFESLGYDVDVVELGIHNWNSLRGVAKLKARLDSSIQIHELDLDAGGPLPRQRYGLVLFLGVLYHLKNPYTVLELLARHADYCVLSTRVARMTTDHKTRFEHIPVAYLVSPHECNNDISNFWIFSSAGLDRLVSRTGWEILGRRHVGNTRHSDPATPEGDERVYLLLKSQHNG